MSISIKPPALSATDLPASSSPDLFIVSVTPAEYEATWLLNAEEWKGPLDLAQYLDRERFLLKQDLTKNDGITAWILTSNELPRNTDGTRPILAACETILKTAYVARDGKVELIRAHGIASVFTRSEYRGRGYAGRMMRELGKQLETYQQPDGHKGVFSVLFSDIGRTFYAKYGWAANASTHIHLSPLSRDLYETQRSGLDEVSDLSRGDVAKLPLADYLQNSMQQISAENPGISYVAIRPDMEHLDWHHAREEIQCKILGLAKPLIKGAIHHASGVAVIWSRVFQTKPQEWTLYILHVAIPAHLRANPTEATRNGLAALLLRAQREAQEWQMVAGVEVWDPSELVVSAAQSLRKKEDDEVEIIRRDKDHICSLRLVANDNVPLDNNTVWLNMEKYTWC